MSKYADILEGLKSLRDVNESVESYANKLSEKITSKWDCSTEYDPRQLKNGVLMVISCDNDREMSEKIKSFLDKEGVKSRTRFSAKGFEVVVDYNKKQAYESALGD